MPPTPPPPGYPRRAGEPRQRSSRPWREAIGRSRPRELAARGERPQAGSPPRASRPGREAAGRSRPCELTARGERPQAGLAPESRPRRRPQAGLSPVTRPQLEDNAVQTISNYCHDLCDLDLSKSHKLNDASLYALAHGCPRLTKLNISGCTGFSDSGLAYLTSFCTKLKYLNLCGCVRAASDKALQAIAYNCRQLQSLTLGWCEGVTDKGVICLALGCPDLRAMDLCGCVLITAMCAEHQCRCWWWKVDRPQRRHVVVGAHHAYDNRLPQNDQPDHNEYSEDESLWRNSVLETWCEPLKLMMEQGEMETIAGGEPERDPGASGGGVTFKSIEHTYEREGMVEEKRIQARMLWRCCLNQMMKEAFALKNTVNKVLLPTKRDTDAPKFITNFRKGSCSMGRKRRGINHVHGSRRGAQQKFAGRKAEVSVTLKN
ncbi:hypothetical protein KSP39_PZI017400 [Platanthera zijinensis]|uniref:F-box/LRR-repeat protein 15-like leucin rich repeat domain-containing protein n=1 Tax=Platanthera zijinensis TaxID=2320716 RepID=A0AAP0B6F0_9ASPA